MSERPNTPSLLSHPDREAAAALPALEDLFRSVARRVRTRLVNRAGSDVPVRLGVAQVTTVGHILDDSETRAGGIFAVFRFEPLGLPGLVVVQGRLLSRIVGVMLGARTKFMGSLTWAADASKVHSLRTLANSWEYLYE